MNLTLAVVLPLACWSPPPRPLVDAPVLSALRGEPMPQSGRPDAVADALAVLSPAKRRPRR
ncbi:MULTISPECIES: hypothetical protein [unclassified Methylobacterium]|uniref:hypothetical protein n=1 Tax=unclassified Methylobacterium TaxID=2615210 RepID=UPI0005BB0F47|nr:MULTISPECIES: hypothetical protein [unclassified Methylobacterium]SFU50559.1 hypothetical protein SAMN02799643_00960 [Methylobacterium sp. UNCCL125]